MHRFTASSLFLAVLLLPMVSGGCYRYSYVERDALRPGEDVRVRLNADEAERVGDILGRDDRVYDGRVLEAPDSTLTLAIRSFIVQQGGATESGHQRIVVPRSSVVEMQLRTLDRPRTAGAIAVAVAATTAAAIISLKAINGKDDKGTKLPGERSRIPGLVIPLRFAIPH
jgi:hypothetical protein